MNRFAIAIVTLFAVYSGYAQNGESYSLEQCIDYAIENNNALKNAALDQEYNKAQIGFTKADGLPQINATASYNNNFAIQSTLIPDFLSPVVYGVLIDENLVPDNIQLPEQGIFPAQFGIQHAGNIGITLNQLLFDGSYFVGLQAARTLLELSSRNYELTKTNITEAVTKAFYTVLVNEERLTLLEKNFNRLDTLLRETRLMYENGFVEKIDVDRLQVQYNNLQVEYDNTQRLVEISYNLLKFQMGMPVNTAIGLTGTLGDIDFDYVLEETPDFSYSNRMEYAVLETQKRLNLLDLKNNKVQYLPSLNAFVNAGYNGGDNEFSNFFDFDNRWFGYGAVGLSMNIPIFDGFRKSYRIQQARINDQMIDNSMNELANGIDLEIVQSRTVLINSIQSLRAQEDNLELAESVFEVTKKKYQEGVGSNLEVLDAETSYKEAETNYYNALFDALINKVNYDKATGNLVNK